MTTIEAEPEELLPAEAAEPAIDLMMVQPQRFKRWAKLGILESASVKVLRNGEADYFKPLAEGFLPVRITYVNGDQAAVRQAIHQEGIDSVGPAIAPE